jgi:histone H3/H4
MEDLVVKSKIREYAKKKGVRLSGEVFDEMNKLIAGKLDKAVMRSKENKRQTIKACDL